MPVDEPLRDHGISKATYFLWRPRYGGATVNELARLKELDTEKAKLKRMYADLALENVAINDVSFRKMQRRPRSGRRSRSWLTNMGAA